MRTESEAFADLRYERLAFLLGLADADHARGKMQRLWRQCTIEQVYDLEELDVCTVLGPKGVDGLIKAGLGERCGDRIRIKGTGGRIEWLANFKGGAETGGKARAATAERGPDGRLLPKSVQPELDQRPLEETPNLPSGIQRNPATPAGGQPAPSSPPATATATATAKNTKTDHSADLDNSALLTLAEVEQLGCAPPHGWRPLGQSRQTVRDAIEGVCPMSRDEWLRHSADTKAKAASPGFAFLAALVRGERKKLAEAAARDPPTKFKIPQALIDAREDMKREGVL